MRQYIGVVRQLDSGKVLGVYLLEGRYRAGIAEQIRDYALEVANTNSVSVEYGVYEPLIAPNMVRVHRGVVGLNEIKTEVHHGNVH